MVLLGIVYLLKINDNSYIMNEIDLLTTDELVEVIIDRVGVSLPTYDYSVYKAYLISIPVNISVGDGVTGIDICDSYKTFREACIAIIKWYFNTFHS